MEPTRDTEIKVGAGIFVQLLLVSLACLPAGAATADETKTWYMAYFHGTTKVGYTQQSRSVHDGKVCYETTGAINYDGVLSRWKLQTSETIDGKPLSFTWEELDDSARTDATFRNGKMEVKQELEGSTTTEVQDAPDGILLGEGDDLLLKKTGLTEGASYSFTSIDHRLATPRQVTVHVGPVKDVTLNGKSEKLHEVIRQEGDFRWVDYVDDNYDYRKETEPGLELIECDKELALSFNFPFELPEPNPLQLPADITEYRTATAMELVLAPDGKSKFTLPATGAQTVTRRPDGSLVVRVRRRQAPPGIAFPYRGTDAEALEALKPSLFYPCLDPRIVETARGAVQGCGDTDQACRQLELFVRAFIVNHDDSSDVTATSILQHRSGHCRQHAVLMVALCRAVGIPARKVLGLVHSGRNQLSGHAWVQCYVGDRWVDYDAALRGFDVAHVALWVGSDSRGVGGLRAAFDHFTVTQVKLEMPWHRWLIWPAVAAVALIPLWLLRRAQKIERSRTTPGPVGGQPQV